jgi:hypothetical protein
MEEFLISVEQTALATFIRESASYWGFPAVLTMHTIGLCFIVGANVLVSARLLGLESTIPVRPLRRLFPFMWVGLVLTFLSGIGLVMAAATTRALNPILLFKLAVIAAAAPVMWIMQKKIFGNPDLNDDALPPIARRLAASQLILWFVVLVAGRLIAYSATILGPGY